MLLSMHADERYFFQAIAAGAAGYVLKRQADCDLRRARRAALRGEPFIYPPALGGLMRHYLRHGEQAERDPLTPRDSEVVKWSS